MCAKCVPRAEGTVPLARAPTRASERPHGAGRRAFPSHKGGDSAWRGKALNANVKLWAGVDCLGSNPAPLPSSCEEIIEFLPLEGGDNRGAHLMKLQ